MNYVLLLGRLLYSLIFILAGISHFSHETIQMAADHGFPMASFLVPASGVLLLLGGLSILLGVKARYGAWLIVIVMVPLTLCIHRFWGVHESMQMLQKIMFLKNLSMIGAALIIAYFGSGPLSVDKHKAKK